RRLRAQALLAARGGRARTRRPAQIDAPAGPAGGSRRAGPRGPGRVASRSADAPRAGGRARAGALAHRIQPAQRLPQGARPGLRAQPVARRGVGQRRGGGRPDGGRARQGAAAQAGGGGRRPQAAGAGPRRGLPPARRAVTLGRQELLVALAIVFLLGLALTISRLIEARKSGLSFRLQIFLPLAATTLTLSAAFAVIVIDRFTARASVFALRGAQDEARVLAEIGRAHV